MSICALGIALVLSSASCDELKRPDGDGAVTSLAAGVVDSARDRAAPALPPITAAEREMYLEVAKSAWQYLDSYYQESTGFVNGTPEWFNTTAWDIGAQILATLAAKELGLLTQAEFDKRTAKTLETLNRAPLFRNAALNKLYSTKDGSLGTGRLGWSATDLGRVFVALKVLAVREPKFAADAERVVRRHDFRQIVKNGYVHGQLIGSKGQPWTFQEGRIGYEQYVARGFAEWGLNVNNALSLRKNGRPVKVNGVEILADKRGLDRLLSEPFILSEIEVGLTPEMRQLATGMLAAMEARYRQTGQVTIVSEDAVGVPPFYFYYYCVYCNKKPFVIDVSSPGNEQEKPRWVSTKGTFGWHAIMPSEYTKRALDYVRPALDAKRGWATGVFEGTGQSTNTFDVNTASVLLEIAYYQLRGRKPMIEAGAVPK